MSMQSMSLAIRGHLLLVAAAAGLCLVSAGARANLVQDGSFEKPVTNGYAIYANGTVPGWTSIVNDKEIEIDAGTVTGLAAKAGNQSVELNGNNYDTISQTITGLTAGQKYLLTWAYAGRQGSGNQEMDTTFDNIRVGVNTDNGTSTPSWSYNSAVVTAAGTSAVLSFAAINLGGNSTVGNELDAVTLNLRVPEPASIALLLTGIAGLVVLRHRRKASLS